MVAHALFTRIDFDVTLIHLTNQSCEAAQYNKIGVHLRDGEKLKLYFAKRMHQGIFGVGEVLDLGSSRQTKRYICSKS